IRERRRVARLTRVVAVDRQRPGRVRDRVAGAPAGQLVGAEPVLGAVGGGDHPVLAVVVAVAGTGLAVDPRTVVGAQMPPLLGRVVDQLTGVSGQRQRGVIGGPAHVAGLRGVVRAAAHIVLALLVPALDET